jgi:hypothetical protein
MIIRHTTPTYLSLLLLLLTISLPPLPTSADSLQNIQRTALLQDQDSTSLLSTIRQYSTANKQLTTNTLKKIRVQASPEEDLEAEISLLSVNLVAEPKSCRVIGTQDMKYSFMNGKNIIYLLLHFQNKRNKPPLLSRFSTNVFLIVFLKLTVFFCRNSTHLTGAFDTLRTQLGDDTTGIDFYTKDILAFNSSNLQSCASPKIEENITKLQCLQTRRRATTKCRSELEWQFPKLVASDKKPKSQNYQIKFSMEMGVVRNETHEYNEMVYSTGFHHRLAIKEIQVSFQLPKKYTKKQIVMMGNSRTSSYGGTYDENSGVVTFIRKTYLAPMNRYTVRVWFPLQNSTKSCAPCSKVEDWLMLIILVPFFFCFIIPCCIHLYGRDATKRSGPLTRNNEFEGEGRTLGGGSGDDNHVGNRNGCCGCCCETPEEGRPVTRTGGGGGEAEEPLLSTRGDSL